MALRTGPGREVVEWFEEVHVSFFPFCSVFPSGVRSGYTDV